MCAFDEQVNFKNDENLHFTMLIYENILITERRIGKTAITYKYSNALFLFDSSKLQN